MKRIVLFGISILAVVLLIIGSQVSVVGYQLVKTSPLHRNVNQKLLSRSYTNFVMKTAVLKSQNSSFLHFVYFMIGFLFGLATLLPVAIFYVYAVSVLMIVYFELFYGKLTLGLLLSLIGKGIVIWIVFLLDYLLYCGFLFQDKLIHFFEDKPYLQFGNHKILLQKG